MAKDYSKLNKEELLKVVEKLETRKKYGLIWDEERTKEKFEKESENALPILKDVGGKEIKDHQPGQPIHVLIEGDNYHALSVLNYTHQNKIDIIYIDPPYNTGNKTWKYNNDYVEKEDAFRHSKWLSFMSKRLRLAKNLLKDTGSLICAIDENEHATLGLLLQEIFPNYEIVCVTIIHNPGGIQGNNFSYTHEYAYFVFPGGGTRISTVERNGGEPTPLRDWGGEESKRATARNCFYPIFVKDGKIIGFGDVVPEKIHPKAANIMNKDGTLSVYPIDSSGVERKWRFARQSIETISAELAAEQVRGEWTIRRYKKNYRWKTVWTDEKYNANVYGTQLLNQIIKKKFPYPKSIYTVEDCIKALIHDKTNAIILDFFAGSGTTAHAVLELNAEDKGQRTFILCTNNEGDICSEICYPRVYNVMSGYKNQKGQRIKGFGGNLKYFKTAFVKKGLGKDELKIRITNECTEMLCLREGIFTKVEEGQDYKVFKEGERIMAIYFSLEKTALDDLKKKLNKLNGQKTLYCFTLDPLGLNKDDFSDWDDINLEPIPQKILDIYQEIYEY